LVYRVDALPCEREKAAEIAQGGFDLE